MNCTTCRYELSQCLDGRLPSGRRTLVLEHAARCRECGTFWDELQAAQRLTLQLRPTRVSEGFRDALWERIRAGEGTPDAVFREPVPIWVKVRYALTGAAAAAAALVAFSVWQQRTPTSHPEPLVAHVPAPAPQTPMAALAGGGGSGSASGAMSLDDTPLLASRQRLTSRLVATEAAKQLEQRHADATLVLRRLDEQPDPHLVTALFDDVEHFRAFGELLLDLHDRDRVSFLDGAVSDLRFAVKILDRANFAQPSLEAARTIVAPVLRSDHLASISRTLFTRDDGEDQDLLQRLAMQRPAVFRELFFPLGHDAALPPQLDGVMGGNLFILVDECGPSWVAPRSEVLAREGMFEFLQRQAGGQRHVQIRIERR